ncbi:hypothetical protein [Bdellovibrio sp.]|uniref:hypothetical protein n=1 Tax=Bdellovibrio sp. TaxID=28201 RepID=UPI0039E2832E
MEENEISNRLASVVKGEADLITELLAIEHELPYGSKDFVAPTIKHLNVKETDIFISATEAIRNGKDIFRVSELLVALFTELRPIEVSTLLNFLQEYFDKTKNDLAGGRFYDSIKEKSKNDIEWALSLTQEILRRRDERLYSFLLTSYLGVTQADFTQGYEKIIKLTKSDESRLKQTGLRGLGLLERVPDSQKEEIAEILSRYSTDSDEDIAASAAFSLCRFAAVSKVLEEKKIELSLIGKPAARYEIMTHIWGNVSNARAISSADLTAIKNICNYNLEHKGITNNLDSLLYLLITNNHINEVEQILTEWVLKHSAEEHRRSIFVESFDSAVFEIVKNQTLLKLLFTKWLNSDDLRFHHVLSKIASYMASRGMRRAEFDLSILASFNYDDHLFIVRKIIGYILDFDISISLVLSILQLDSFDKDVGDLVASVLVEYIGYNYTYKTIQRLQSELESSSEQAKKILNLCIKELETRSNKLKSLNRANELLPNSDHAIRLNKSFQKAMSKSMEEARAKSPLLGMVSQVSIREGLSWFSFHHGQYHEPSKMNHFSHGIELPRKDVLDEIGASMERVEFRQAKRGES